MRTECDMVSSATAKDVYSPQENNQPRTPVSISPTKRFFFFFLNRATRVSLVRQFKCISVHGHSHRVQNFVNPAPSMLHLRKGNKTACRGQHEGRSETVPARTVRDMFLPAEKEETYLLAITMFKDRDAQVSMPCEVSWLTSSKSLTDHRNNTKPVEFTCWPLNVLITHIVVDEPSRRSSTLVTSYLQGYHTLKSFQLEAHTKHLPRFGVSMKTILMSGSQSDQWNGGLFFTQLT